MITKRIWQACWAALLLLSLLSACSPGAKRLIIFPSAHTPTPPVLSQPTPPKSGISADGELFAPPHDPNPLVFTFPTPEAPAVSLWRPPLYDVPWAAGPQDHFYFVRPIAADEVNWPLADYRYGAILPNSIYVHTGVDIDARLHTPVLAAGAGKVISAGYGLYSGSNDQNDPYGMAVTISHDFGYQGRKIYTIYAHLDRIDVVAGQRVEAGDALGIVGLTGNTSGPHLHFEVRLENNSFFTTQNPELWLAPPQGWGVLVGKLLNTNRSLLTGQEVNVTSNESGRKWRVISYTTPAIKSDEYYRENLVLSDLPSGDYTISIPYLDETYTTHISIHPGAVTYINFRGKYGFSFDFPKTSSPQEWDRFLTATGQLQNP